MAHAVLQRSPPTFASRGGRAERGVVTHVNAKACKSCAGVPAPCMLVFKGIPPRQELGTSDSRAVLQPAVVDVVRISSNSFRMSLQYVSAVEDVHLLAS